MNISVALCTCNGSQFLPIQLDSILAQQIPPDEIVVCDDSSEDATPEILEKYANTFPGVFNIIRNESRLGSIKNFENAVSLCNGKLIFLCDQDDFWIPEKTKIITEFFSTHPEISAVSTNGYIMGENSEIDDHFFTSWDVFGEISESFRDFDYFKFLTEKGNFATGATMAFRKNFAKEAIPFPNRLPNYHHDEWLATFAAATRSFAFINKKLIYYRIHPNQQVGGIAFKTASERARIKAHFISAEDSFSAKKLALKQKISWYNNFFSKFDNCGTAAYETIKAEFFSELERQKKELKIQYPVRASGQFFYDNIAGKRQLRSN